MRLTSLELFGFKSFADATRITFGEGITAIVGPNGCGKSNLSDAIRWVLGVQSSRLLRGKKMEDLIFDGSGTRRRQGLAEVSAVLSDFEGLIPVPEVGRFPEVTVSRKLFRDGQSEYFINKTRCRLRDVTDLFLEVGIGSNALAVIEQGQIESLITAKPEDRRFIIEEAAGVVKYKERRTVALGKLEKAQADLERVSDIIGEVQRRVNALQRQARAAERYRALQQEIRERDLALLRHELRALSQQLEETSALLATKREEEQARSGGLSSQEADLERLRIEAAQTGEAITRTRRDAHEVEKALDAHEHAIASARRRKEDLTRSEREWDEEAEALAEKGADLGGEREERRTELRQMESRLVSARREEAALRQRLEEAASRHTQVRQAMEEGRSRLIDLLQAEARVRNEDAEARSRCRALEHRRRQMEEEERADQTRIAELHSEQAELEAAQDREALRAASLTEEHKRLREQLLSSEEEAKQVETQLFQLQRLLSGLTAKLQALEEVRRTGEDLGEGARSLLQAREQGNGLRGLRGLVGHFLEVDPEFEVAIGALLGHCEQHLVVDDIETSRRALEYLRNNGGGRGTLIPLQPHFLPNGYQSSADRPGVLGPALRWVRFPEEYRQVMTLLLGRAVMVQDLDTALALWNAGERSAVLVTPTGEILDPSGSLTGGSSEQAGGTLLARNRTVRELRERSAQIGAEEAELSALRAQLRQAGGEMGEALARLAGQLEEARLELSSARNRSAALQGEQDRLRERAQGRAYEEELAREVEELSHAMSVWEERLQAVEREIESVREVIKGSEAASPQAEAEAQRLRDEVTQKRIECVGLQGEVQAVQQALAALESRQEELDARSDRLDRLAQEASAEKVCLQEETQRAEERILSLARERETIEQRLRELEEQDREWQEVESARRRHVQEGRGELETLREEVGRLSVREAELRVQRDSVVRRAFESHGAALQADDAPSQALDPEVERPAIEEMREKLRRFGNVNLNALEEYEEQRERLDFLTAQYADLGESIRQLHEAIDKINRTTRDRFSTAFQTINQHFSRVFTQLFGGGSGELVLTDQQDLLDSGVDILMRPPGKTPSHIGLLSSGEKALASLALLFAVFLSKPSPFCLLDEVDASLDDPNVEKLGRLLNELSRSTQFILITHNKKTMEMADSLYGVTMEEEGVSKVLSLRLERQPEMAAADPG